MSFLDELRQKPSRIVIGLNSGTSVDGVDVAIVRIDGSGVDLKAELLAFDNVKHPKAARDAILEVSDPSTGTVDKICRANFLVGELFAEAAQSVISKSGMELGDIDVIASHGQTIYHIPPTTMNGTTVPGSTLQIGEPSIIAERTGVTTVADFRPRDMAAGGHAVPALAYPDFLLFRDPDRTISVQNIGGIANLTLLRAGANPDDILAFDTGPGNMVIDGAMERISGGDATYDNDGEFAASGQVHEDLLKELLDHPYFRQPPPKSTGREDFGREYLAMVFERSKFYNLSDEDLVATITALTADTVHLNYELFCFPHGPIDEIILSGGGAFNQTLVGMLRGRFAPIHVSTLEDHGVNPDAREAMCWAVVGHEAIMGNPNNGPAATGARKWVLCGKILPPGPGV